MTMPASNNTAARRYLDLLRHALCRDRFPDARYEASSGSLQLMPFDPALRAQGKDWPLEAMTMVGAKRLENLESLLRCLTGKDSRRLRRNRRLARRLWNSHARGSGSNGERRPQSLAVRFLRRIAPTGREKLSARCTGPSLDFQRISLGEGESKLRTLRFAGRDNAICGGLVPGHNSGGAGAVDRRPAVGRRSVRIDLAGPESSLSQSFAGRFCHHRRLRFSDLQSSGGRFPAIAFNSVADCYD